MGAPTQVVPQFVLRPDTTPLPKKLIGELGVLAVTFAAASSAYLVSRVAVAGELGMIKHAMEPVAVRLIVPVVLEPWVTVTSFDVVVLVTSAVTRSAALAGPAVITLTTVP